MNLQQLILFSLDLIASVTRAVFEARDGKITPDQALIRIREAAHEDRTVDAKADAQLAAKFPDQT